MDMAVIMPCYNRLEFTRIALPNLIEMSVGAKHIIVVNDGSTDGTKEYIEKFASDKIKIVNHEKNDGLPVAYNSGFSMAKGLGCDAAIIVDNDVLVPYGFDVTLDQNISVGMQICGGLVCNDRNVLKWMRRNYPSGSPNGPVETDTIGGGSALAIPIDCWEKIKGFHEPAGSFAYTDVKFLNKARGLGYRVFTDARVMCFELQQFAHTDIAYERLKVEARCRKRGIPMSDVDDVLKKNLSGRCQIVWGQP